MESLEEIKKEMCDRYCKWPKFYKVREETYQKSAEDMKQDICSKCPLNNYEHRAD